MPSYVYILQGSPDRYYIGSTNDLERRIKQHMSGHTHTTRRIGKFKLVFSQEYQNLKDARKIERRLKRMKRKDYIDKIVKKGRITLRLLLSSAPT